MPSDPLYWHELNILMPEKRNHLMNNKPILILVVIILAVIAGLLFVEVTQDGPVEEASEEVSSVIDDTGDSIENKF